MVTNIELFQEKSTTPMLQFLVHLAMATVRQVKGIAIALLL
jgi:hypothetical protein